jgi:hypothetical protein
VPLCLPGYLKPTQVGPPGQHLCQQRPATTATVNPVRRLHLKPTLKPTLEPTHLASTSVSSASQSTTSGCRPHADADGHFARPPGSAGNSRRNSGRCLWMRGRSVRAPICGVGCRVEGLRGFSWAVGSLGAGTPGGLLVDARAQRARANLRGVPPGRVEGLGEWGGRALERKHGGEVLVGAPTSRLSLATHTGTTLCASTSWKGQPSGRRSDTCEHHRCPCLRCACTRAYAVHALSAHAPSARASSFTCPSPLES